jgi:hypothetical protein
VSPLRFKVFSSRLFIRLLMQLLVACLGILLTAYYIGHRRTGWLVSNEGKECGKKRSWPYLRQALLYQHFPDGTDEDHETPSIRSFETGTFKQCRGPCLSTRPCHICFHFM